MTTPQVMLVDKESCNHLSSEQLQNYIHHLKIMIGDPKFFTKQGDNNENLYSKRVNGAALRVRNGIRGRDSV